MSVEDKNGGRQVECPQCKQVCDVPRLEDRIEIVCEHCSCRIIVAKSHVGEKGKCPKCKGEVVVQPQKTNTSNASDHCPSGLTDMKDSVVQLDFTGIPQENDVISVQVVRKDSDEDEFEGFQQQRPPVEAEDDTKADQRKLPWLIDIWLYPLNVAGVMHLIFLWLLVFLFCPLIMTFIGLGDEYIPFVYTLPVAYMVYYFTECIRYSDTGHFRAPDFWNHPLEDKWEHISQFLMVLGSIAVCFCPASAYYIVTERSDFVHWLLMACGGFFFPMILLAVVLFDSYDALKPILIVSSIFRTFFPYCGLVLLYYGGALLFLKIDSRLYSFRLLPLVPFISRALQLYLIFVAVGLLGRFFHKYEEKLYWEV